MSAVVPFLRASDARASAAWWARLGMREAELGDPDGNRVGVGTPSA